MNDRQEKASEKLVQMLSYSIKVAEASRLPKLTILSALIHLASLVLDDTKREAS